MDWFKNGLKQPGKSGAGLARHMGWDPSVPSKIASGKRLIKAPEVAKIAEYFGNQPFYEAPGNARPGPTAGLLSDKTIPIYASAEGGTFGMTISYEPIEHIPCPGPLVGVRNAFGFYVLGDSMEPRYSAGDLVCVHPTKPVRRGNYVLVILKSADQMDHDALIKRLVSMDSQHIVLEQLNPPKKLDPIPRDRVQGIHLIVASFEGGV